MQHRHHRVRYGRVTLAGCAVAVAISMRSCDWVQVCLAGAEIPGTFWSRVRSRTSATAARSPTQRFSQHSGFSSGKAPKKKRTYIRTADAAFLTSANQPLLLSPDGIRTASFEFVEKGLGLKVEPAPNFGPDGSSATMATRPDESIGIVPRERLGIMGVRDLYWLDDHRFLITGYEGSSRQTFGWIADLQTKATLISVPSKESSLFLPADSNGLPLQRLTEQGTPEILLGFSTPGPDGLVKREWSWYSAADDDSIDAAEDAELSTDLWREVVLGEFGLIEAILLVNGTVYRRTPEGFRDIGTIALAAAEGWDGVAPSQSVLPRQYLVGVGPDYSVFAIDVLGPKSSPPQAHPPWADLVMSQAEEAKLPADRSSASLAAWTLEQSRKRQTAALVQMTADESIPTPLFAHPFADLTSEGVWVDPQSGLPEAVAVTDVRPHVYALSTQAATLLLSLRQKLPASMQLGGVTLATDNLEPQLVYRHGSRWLVVYWHPTVGVASLPVLVQDGAASWIGNQIIPARGLALDAQVAPLEPRIEAHRLRVGDLDVPLYLVRPKKNPGGVVVLVHEGPHQRDDWGANSFDAWLLSRGYAILKVNYRGSTGFGEQFRTASAGEGFLDDIVAAVRWTLDVFSEGRADGSSAPPVAIMGEYFGGYAVLQALKNHEELFACGIAIAPPQSILSWPNSYIPNAATRKSVEAVRMGSSAPSGGADPAEAILSPLSYAQRLRQVPLLLVEYENDYPEVRGNLFQRLSPSSVPSEWPEALTFVQYAGEDTGGGTIRQNSLDKCRRIDSFLYKHLSPAAFGDGLQRERFQQELAFVSACLVPGAKIRLTEMALNIEQGIEQALRRMDPEQARRLPKAGEVSATREVVTTPPFRITVREDNIIEVTLLFGVEPVGLHVFLSEICLHVRAEGLSFTVALPRAPQHDQKVEVFRFPDGQSYVLEIAADPNVGAIENYNQWASRGGLHILSMLRPEDFAMAPISLPVQ